MEKILLYGATGFYRNINVIETLKNSLQPGFQTPFRLLGAEILNEIPGFTLNLNEVR